MHVDTTAALRCPVPWPQVVGGNGLDEEERQHSTACRKYTAFYLQVGRAAR